jgi:hypothetical protein
MKKGRIDTALHTAPVVTCMKTLMMVFNFIFWVSVSNKCPRLYLVCSSIHHLAGTGLTQCLALCDISNSNDPTVTALGDN